ncbi:phage tail-collar fiber domain-containing protein [Edwardsiella tarda]
MMSQAAITLAFEKFKAQEAAGGRTLILDEFVLANVPGLDPSAPVDRSEGLPPTEQIVHRQAVNTTGVVNEHAVAYSITMGTEVGDFDFNWLGLMNKATGLLAMVVHVPTQRKIANTAGQQGNALTRSFLMEFDGAAAATGITTPAETWQIDFTARLHGMDEMQRLANRDLYGAGAFFEDGFLVVRQGAGYTATAGIGYIGGLRAELTGNKPLSIGSKPTKVWADVSLQGNVTSAWDTVVALTVAETMVDYVDQGGFAHYVFAVAGIDAAGTVTDLRPKGSTTDQASQEAAQKLRDDLDAHVRSRNHPDATLADKGFVRLFSGVDSSDETMAATPKAVKIAMDNANARLAKERNLADLTNIALARQNLQLGDSAIKNTGTTVGTVAAGDDGRITGAMQKNQHGTDIPDKALFIDNIGLRETVDLARDAYSKKVVKTVHDGELLASCITPGFYSISINDAKTVDDFPKVHGSPIYSYGVMMVVKNDNTIEQLFISHKGHVATRQTWYGPERYEPWVVQYSSVNKPTHGDLELGDSASKNVGSTSGTVAAGDDVRFSYPIGINQTWHNVKSSRRIGVVYTNSSPRSIFVFAEVRPPAGATAVIEVDGIISATTASVGEVFAGGIGAIVPPGSQYIIKASIGGSPSLSVWSELF